jgi:hypothetical protein
MMHFENRNRKYSITFPEGPWNVCDVVRVFDVFVVCWFVFVLLCYCKVYIVEATREVAKRRFVV